MPLISNRKSVMAVTIFFRSLLLFSVTIAGAAMTSLPSSAQVAAANNPAVRAAFSNCKVDHQKFCANVAPGGGRVLRCLSDRADALTPACRKSLEDVRASAGSVRPR